MADSVFNSKPNTVKVTFLPGKTITDYKKAFTDAGYAPEDFEDAFNYKYPTLSLADRPQSQSLEVCFQPKTYTNLNKLEDTPIKIISTNLDETDQLVADEFKQVIAKEGLTIHHAFTLNSIVPQESPDPDTQK